MPRSPLEAEEQMYAAGWADGWRDAESAAAASWKPLAAWVRGTANSPSYNVLAARRATPDTDPCSDRCRRCSRCVGSLAYWGRGGRDWLGVEAEAPTRAASRVDGAP
ncbi:MAG: hypothetical protein M3042_12145 [Actinomycetota bacterium]|nr:hypothetical protein [Actinomycetota bacterium]